MRNIAQHVYLQVFCKYLFPVASPQKKANNQDTDNTAEKQYLEGIQLDRKLPTADGHGGKRYQRAAHPECGNNRMISIRLCDWDDVGLRLFEFMFVNIYVIILLW